MYTYHYARQSEVPCPAEALFRHLDDPTRLSAHMGRASWQMGGGKMSIELGDGGWQQVGATALMQGRALGIALRVRSRLVEYAPPQRKTWETDGEPDLLMIGRYRMGLEISDRPAGALLRVFIDYDPPQHFPARALGVVFGRFYARWCVDTMVADALKHFSLR